MKTKFKVGDKVKVVKYGSMFWISKTEWKELQRVGATRKDKPEHILFESIDWYCVDKAHGWVGREDVVTKVGEPLLYGDGKMKVQYALSTCAWFHEEQLELISPD